MENIKFGKKPISADENLWKKYLGTYQPPKADPQSAEQTLLLMINTQLNKQVDITKSIKVGFASQLIKDAEWKLNDEETIKKIRSVLNKVVEEKLKLIPTYSDSKFEYKGDEEEDFRKVVSLLQVIKDTEIKVLEIKDTKGKIQKDWVISISYQTKTTPRAKFVRNIQDYWTCQQCSYQFNHENMSCQRCGWLWEYNNLLNI